MDSSAVTVRAICLRRFGESYNLQFVIQVVIFEHVSFQKRNQFNLGRVFFKISNFFFDLGRDFRKENKPAILILL